MRLFIGIGVSGELKEKVSEVQKRFREFDIKFVEKENLHFNLKFLGEVPEDKIAEIKDVMTKIGSQFENFTINIAGINAFPNKNYVKVLFLEVKEGRETMNAIADVLELGLGKSDKPFIPHLTLGRVKSVQDREKLKSLLREMQNIEIGKMEVSKIKLIKSDLAPSGPIYQDVFTTKLGS